MSLPNILSWKIEIPLISNRFIVGNVAKGLSITLLLFFIIMGSIFGSSDGWKGVEQALIICLWAGLFLIAVSFFTLAVFLGNKYLLEFNINQAGVIMRSRSERAHFAHRLAIILGMLRGNSAAIGAGSVAMAGETTFLPWNRIRAVKVYQDKKIIRLKRNFLETMYIYCTSENFQNACATIDKRVAENRGRPDMEGEVSLETGEILGSDIDISDLPSNVACPKCNTGDFSRKADYAVRRLRAVPEKDDPTDKELEDQIRREEIIGYLERPQEPVLFPLSRWVLILLIPIANIIAIFFAPLIKGLKIFISVINIIFIASVIWAVGFAGDYHEAQNVVALIGFFMCILYLICLVYSWNAAKAGYNAKLAEYEPILSRWEHLFNCDKCNIVFFDDLSGSSAPVEEVKSFLAS